jgi:hypothetical protein
MLVQGDLLREQSDQSPMIGAAVQKITRSRGLPDRVWTRRMARVLIPTGSPGGNARKYAPLSAASSCLAPDVPYGGAGALHSVHGAAQSAAADRPTSERTRQESRL